MYDRKMESKDQDEELQRLREMYSTMTDEELKELASDKAALKDSAQAALKDEMDRRRLEVILEEPPSITDPIEEPELTTIRKFRDLPEALLAKGLLESIGIECFLLDDNMVRMDWFISNAIGNMRLQVKQEDAEAAIALLDQPILDIDEDKGQDS
jgi:hypothetical protein